MTFPDVGLGIWIIALAAVDFPQPDSPTMPSVSHFWMSKLMSETACTFCLRPDGNSITRFSTLRRMLSEV